MHKKYSGRKINFLEVSLSPSSLKRGYSSAHHQLPSCPWMGYDREGGVGADSPDHLELPILMGQPKAHNPSLKSPPYKQTTFLIT